MKTEEVLLTGARELGVQLTAQQIGLFLDYLENLKTWNKKVNLTGIKDEREIIIGHFLDSISVVPFITQNSKLLDIGSGAGFPGIPLKIVLPPLEVVLLDSVEKKVFFMRDVIRKLGLGRINAVYGRAEDHDNGVARYHFEVVVSRAVGKIQKLLKVGIPYLTEGGKIVLMRGRSGLAEWDQIRDEAAQKFRLLEHKEFSLPFEKHQRVILVIERI